MSPARASADSRFALLRTWWPVVLGAALLVARKPWALSTPQLHAEDGSIFLQQNEQLGAAAILVPYQGYLHTLPRLIAWFASHTADPARWPAIYNGAAFLVTVGLLARFASPRLDVPGKPWLVLAFALVAHTGEVLLNVTNLQWLTAFFLVQQVLMTRPATWAQRAGDFIILALAGLTGPFALVFLPLFVWRTWRERNADAFAVLLVVAGCASVQGWFLSHTGTPPETNSPSFDPKVLAGLVGARLLLWPMLGEKLTAALPLPVLIVAGCGLLVALAAWALRPHPRRLLRAQILAAAVLITTACVCRLRPSEWGTVNLVNGDRYFYIPRVLVAWLLVWEFDAAPRPIAWAARTLCLAGALANLPHLRLPAPPDLHWAEHCDPIRRGVPAKIPTLPEGWWLDYPGRPHK
jgi:hypothetical protein